VQLPSAVREFRVGAIFLAAALALTVAYFVVPRGAAQNDINEVIGIASALAIVLGVRLNRPSFPLPWLLFAAGNLLFALGDVVFNQLSNPPTPSAADWFYLAGYPALATGLVLLLIRGGGHHRTAALGEAAIVTFAFALFQWVWIVDGILDGGGSTASRAVTAAYPMMDVVLLAGLAGFFVTAAWRAPAFVLLVASVVALLVADEVYGVGTNAYKSGDWTDLGWLLSYILWAAAALHPSMKELSQPRRRRSYLRVHPVRIALLAAALLSAPFVLLVQYLRDAPLNVLAIVIAATAISIFVLLRLVGILRALERLRERERSARADAEQAQMLLAMQNDQLVEADKLKDEFVALISHDLRTPLTSIIGYVELSLEDVPPPLDDERRGYLQIVSRSSERLLRARRRPALRCASAGGSAHPRAVRSRSVHDCCAGGPGGTAARGSQATRAGVHRRLAGDDRGRQGKTLPVARQPDLERDQVHSGGRPRRSTRRPVWRHGHARGERHGNRSRPG